MSRDVPAGIDAILDDPFVIPVWFVEFDFDTDPVYVHTDVGDITVLSHTWLGAGPLGSISPIEESTKPGATPGVKFRLDLTDESAGSIFEELVTPQDFYQRPVIVYLSFRNVVTGALYADPFQVSAKKVDVPELQDGGGGESYVELVAETELFDGRRPNGRLYSHAQNLSQNPGDTAFKFVAIMANTTIRWAGKEIVNFGAGSGAPALPPPPSRPGGPQLP